MNVAGTATLGDFGAGGPRSDVLIDTQSAAREAAVGEWEFLAAGNHTIGWHVPDTGATVLIKGGDAGWKLELSIPVSLPVAWVARICWKSSLRVPLCWRGIHWSGNEHSLVVMAVGGWDSFAAIES
jgi:hypothetical protein